MQNQNKHYGISLFIIGLSTSIIQILCIKLFLLVYNNHEAVSGIVISNWLILSAVGAYLSKQSFHKQIPAYSLHLLLAIAGIVQILLIIYTRKWYFPPGLNANLPSIYLLSLILMLPVGLFNGIVFTAFSTRLEVILHHKSISRVFALESWGSALGGLIFSFVVLLLFTAVQTAVLIAFINVLAAMLLNFKRSSLFIKTGFILSVVVIIIGFTIVSYTPFKSVSPETPDSFISNLTPYGPISYQQQSEHIHLYENGQFLGSTENRRMREEVICIGLNSCIKTDTILIIGGLEYGLLEEIQKYNVKVVYYFEENQYKLDVLKKLNVIPDSQTYISIQQDIRTYLRTSNTLFDAVIIGYTMPSGIHQNRYFTHEFYGEIKGKLNDNACLISQLSGGASHMNNERIALTKTILNSLQLTFNNTQLLVSQNIYFISSQREHIEPWKVFETDLSDNVWFNENYINEYEIRFDSDQLIHLLDESQIQSLNEDFKPIASYHSLRYMEEIYGGKRWILISLLLIFLLLLGIMRTSKSNIFLFNTGLIIASGELLIIYYLQMRYGNIYQLIGIVFALMFTGLGMGSYLTSIFLEHLHKKKILVISLAGLCLFCLISLSQLFFLNINNNVIYALNILIILFLGVIGGIIFSLVAFSKRLSVKKSSAISYSSDLIGASAGSLLISILLLPTVGFVVSWLALIGIAIISFLFALNKSAI